MTRLRVRRALHPLHAMLLAFPLVGFLAAVMTDLAYLQTMEMQWSHFSAWLITGGLIGGALVFVWAVVDFVRHRPALGWRSLAYPVLIAAMCIVALINIFLHSRDAWYSVTAAGLGLSITAAVLAVVASWLGYAGYPEGDDV